MPTPKLTMSVNAGAYVTGFESGGFGGVTGPDSSTVQLGAQSTDGWVSQTWQLYDYPPGFSPGGGWTLSASGVWENTNLNPSSFLCPATMWGKWMTRVLVTYGDGTTVMDDSTAFQIVSVDGLVAIAASEGSQFGGPRQRYAAPLDTTIRALQSLVGGGPGTMLSVAGAGPFNNLVVADGYDAIYFPDAVTAIVILTGIVAPSGGKSRRLAIVSPHGSFGVACPHLDGGSTGINQFENAEPAASVNTDTIYLGGAVGHWRRIAYPG